MSPNEQAIKFNPSDRHYLEDCGAEFAPSQEVGVLLPENFNPTHFNSTMQKLVQGQSPFIIYHQEAIKNDGSLVSSERLKYWADICKQPDHYLKDYDGNPFYWMAAKVGFPKQGYWFASVGYMGIATVASWALNKVIIKPFIKPIISKYFPKKPPGPKDPKGGPPSSPPALVVETTTKAVATEPTGSSGTTRTINWGTGLLFGTLAVVGIAAAVLIAMTPAAPAEVEVLPAIGAATSACLAAFGFSHMDSRKNDVPMA